MIIYYHKFWKGFYDKSDPNHIGFFQELFKKVFDQELIVGSAEEADILVETVFDTSIVNTKKWKYSFLYSGESFWTHNPSNYTCALGFKETEGVFIKCPLFTVYTWCNFLKWHVKDAPESRAILPSYEHNAVCVIISNPHGKIRNRCIERIEEAGIQVVFAGSYRNSGVRFRDNYFTKVFQYFLSQFKFVISMENSSEDVYITEKLVNGCISSAIPIYWGCKNVSQYFNSKRFIQVTDPEDNAWIQRMKDIISNDHLYIEPMYPDGTSPINIDTVADEIKKKLGLLAKAEISAEV
jgi:hypothetical protein